MWRRGVVSALAGALVAVTISAPAYADDAYHTSCANFPGTICLVQNGDWTGAVWRQTPAQIISYFNACRTLTGYNDIATIGFNNTTAGYVLRVWSDSGCSGNYIQVPSGRAQVFVGPTYGWINDKASSVQLIAL
jgi:hypothetical protein